MNLEKLAKALGVSTSCDKDEIMYLRTTYGVGIDTAREIIIEPRVLERISYLSKLVEENKKLIEENKFFKQLYINAGKAENFEDKINED